MPALILSFLVCLTLAHADDASEYTEGWSRIAADSVRRNFILNGEMFVLDQTGTRFLAPTSEMRQWRAGVKSNKIENLWLVKAKGFKTIALRHVWTLNKDNSIDVEIEQCASFTDGNPGSCVNQIRREKKKLENFEVISWVADTTADARVVVRFTPTFDDQRERENLDRIPIGGDRGTFDVYDNQGHHWSSQTRFGGVFSGLTSPFGSVAFSLYPFPGARELGHARGKYIELQVTDELRITVRNEEVLIPGEMRVKVYAKYLPKLKSKPGGGTTSFGHDRSDTIPEAFR